MEYFWCY